MITRALIELYKNDLIRHSLAFRGGTALNKLFIQPAARYSEDIDMVQINNEPIGKIFGAIRSILDPWLGEARWSQNNRSAKLIYRFQSEDTPSIPLRLKIEINTTEFFTLYGYQEYQLSAETHWFSGSATIKTYLLEELMGTKLRALYQRLKGRDLFDLWYVLTKMNVDQDKIIDAFKKYNNENKISISRAEFEKNLTQKMDTDEFINDIKVLLTENTHWDPQTAYRIVMDELVVKLPGKPWKDLLSDKPNGI